jgi:hypothetical protein
MQTLPHKRLVKMTSTWEIGDIVPISYLFDVMNNITNKEVFSIGVVQKFSLKDVC